MAVSMVTVHNAATYADWLAAWVRDGAWMLLNVCLRLIVRSNIEYCF